jgi:phosphotransferase system HPr (HPr) family protein
MSASSEPVAGSAVRVVELALDLHARPAGQVAQAAARHEATVELVAGARQANARSVLAVMSLGAVTGSSVRVLASGADAVAAADAIADILTTPEHP